MRAQPIRGLDDVKQLGKRFKNPGIEPRLFDTPIGPEADLRYAPESFSEFQTMQLAKGIGIPVSECLPLYSWVDLRYGQKGAVIGLKGEGRYKKDYNTRFGYLIARPSGADIFNRRPSLRFRNEFFLSLQLLRFFWRRPRANVDFARNHPSSYQFWRPGEPDDVFPAINAQTQTSATWLQSFEDIDTGFGSSEPRDTVTDVLDSWRDAGFEDELMPRLRRICQATERERLEWTTIEGMPNDRLLSFFFASLVTERLNLVASIIGETTQPTIDWREALSQPQWGIKESVAVAP